MKNVHYIYETCKEMLDDLNIETGNIINIKVNTRAQKRWGRCKRVPTPYGISYEIEISSSLLSDDLDDEPAENTMIHELLHSVDGCMNHGAKWKSLADKVKKKYGYDIKRCTSAEEKGVDTSVKAKHKIVCTKCGHVGYRMRESKVTKHPEWFACGVCGGNLKLEY